MTACKNCDASIVLNEWSCWTHTHGRYECELPPGPGGYKKAEPDGTKDCCDA